MRERAQYERQADRDREQPPHARALDVPRRITAIGNRATAALLARDPTPGPDPNPTERTFTDPASGNAVRRVRVDGVTGGHTDVAIAVLPPSLPQKGEPVDVLLFLHGYHVRGAHGYDPDHGGPKGAAREGDDVAFHQIEQQMAAAGRNIVGILPQGGHTSEFNPAGKKDGKGFNADDYIRSVFERLDKMKEWKTPVPPTPGGVILAGHSGADVAIDEMLSGPLGPHKLRALFLFDTMWPDKGYEQHIWKRIETRLTEDLAELQRINANESDPDRAAALMATWVYANGFRLFDVFGKDETYDKSSRKLGELVHAWLRRDDVRRVLGTPGTIVYDAVAGNLVVGFGGGDHDHKLSAHHHLQTAIRMLQ